MLSNISNTDIISILHKTLPTYYQQTGSLIPISATLIVLHRHIQHHQEIDRFLKTLAQKFCTCTSYNTLILFGIRISTFNQI